MSHLSASEEFKNKLENFLQNITSNSTDTNRIDKIQVEYNELMDICKLKNYK